MACSHRLSQAMEINIYIFVHFTNLQQFRDGAAAAVFGFYHRYKPSGYYRFWTRDNK